MQGRVHIVEEVPDMANNHAHELVLGNGAVQHKTNAHENPRQVRRAKHQQPQKTHKGIRVAARPDVDQGGRQRVAEEGHGDEGRQEEQAGHGVDQQPREIGRRPARGLLEEARIALQEVDVEEQVDGEGAEVEEGGE